MRKRGLALTGLAMALSACTTAERWICGDPPAERKTNTIAAGEASGSREGTGDRDAATKDAFSGSEPAAKPKELALPEESASKCDSSTAAFNVAVRGQATASHPSDEASEDAAFAFDDHTGTKWSETRSATPWLAYEFAGTEAHAVVRYTITSSYDGAAGSDPKAWKLEGSNDGAGEEAKSWTTLDTRSGQTFPSRVSMKSYPVANKTAYHRYRLSIVANGGGAGVQLSDLQLFEAGTPVFSVDDSVEGSAKNQFHYSDGWEKHGTGDTEVVPPKYNRSSSWNRAKNEQATVSFTGSQIRLYGVRHVQHGIAAVSIDEGPETEVDTYGPLSGNVLLYVSPTLCPPGLHTLMVRTTGKKNPSAKDAYLSIDRVQIVP